MSVFENNRQWMKNLAALLVLCFIILISLSSCSTVTPTQGLTQVTIQVDGKSIISELPLGITIQTTLDSNGITLGALDRVEPATTSMIIASQLIRVVRIREVFEVEETVIAFTPQTVKNESLPQGQTLLVQPGVNGMQQITYRRVLEDGVEISRSAVKTITVLEPKPEIVMVGVQTPFTPTAITRKLVYLTAGSAWVMQRNTGERKPIVTTGDLDGRVFTLSQDGKWLLFTRKSIRPASEEINSLWAVDVTADTPHPFDLKARNIIHFAAWVPGVPNTVYYSSVEPRAAAPGWQANNDLQSLVFSTAGDYVRKDEIITANSGGIYGWWGTTYSWTSDGKQLAYARPDSTGTVDLEKKKLVPLVSLLPYQASGNWAWVPGLTWSPDRRVLYLVTHARKAGTASEESSPIFNLSAFGFEFGINVDIVQQSGMFAYPACSPLLPGKSFIITYLQAIFPEKSENSRYQLMIMDRDGSNRRLLFPAEGAAGLEPQQVVWSPLPSDNKPFLAVLYQGNLWLIDPFSGKAQQITGDGTISNIDWK